MNDPRTCVYGHARKFGACGERGTCTRPRGLPCLCGLVKARVPEPGPDKLTRQRNEFTSRRASAWTHRQIHTCLGCGEEFDTEHRAAFHVCVGGAAVADNGYARELADPKRAEQMRRWLTGDWNIEGTATGRISSHEPNVGELPGSPALRRTAQRSLGLEDLDLSDVEHRVLAICTCEEAATIKAEAWDALGRCPWDNWKPGRDVA